MPNYCHWVGCKAVVGSICERLVVSSIDDREMDEVAMLMDGD